MYKNKWIFVLLLSITALIISGSAAYFSVFGLSKLFAGAGLSALILFGALEIGKIISVSVLYRYWKRFSFFLRTIFTSMVIGIMFITSMGIYGFLRNAYDQTSVQLTTIEKETTIKEQRKNFIQLEIDRYQKEVDSKNKQIDTYISNRDVQEKLVSDLYTQSADTNINKNQSWVYRTRAKETQDAIKESDNLINQIRSENSELYTKINSLNDSISKIDRDILELQSTDIAVEIGPLKYLSELTGFEMDDVVGFLIFLIIFVFDPFAIILIMSANALSMKTPDEIEYYEKRKKEKEEKKEKLISNNNDNIIHKNIKKLAQNYTDNRIQKDINKIYKDIEELNSIKSNVDDLVNFVNNYNNKSETEYNTIKENMDEIFKLKNDLDNKTNDIDNIKENINDLYKIRNNIEKLDNYIKDNNKKNENDILNLKNNIDDFKDELNKNDNKNNIEFNKLKNILNNITESLKNDEFEEQLKSLNKKINHLMDNKDNEKFKDMFNDFKEKLEDELKDYVNILNKKIEKLNKNENLYNELNQIKLNYDKKLNEINKKINEKIEIIETIPGRNMRRPGARIPEQQIKKEI
jgi:hypothetical protein